MFTGIMEQRPVDAGQMVDVQYCCDGEYVYRRTHDRADQTTIWTRAKVDEEAEIEHLASYDVPTYGDWMTCAEPQED